MGVERDGAGADRAGVLGQMRQCGEQGWHSTRMDGREGDVPSGEAWCGDRDGHAIWGYYPVKDDRSDFTHSHVHYQEIQARTCSGLLFSSVKYFTPTHMVVWHGHQRGHPAEVMSPVRGCIARGCPRRHTDAENGVL